MYAAVSSSSKSLCSKAVSKSAGSSVNKNNFQFGFGFSSTALFGRRNGGLMHDQKRTIARIPPWEYHMRFDPSVGRKIPAKDVLDRFKRLNNGMWIRTQPGRKSRRYMASEPWLTQSLYHVTCTKEECWVLDRMMTPFWQRPKYYPDDPYQEYHVRHGLNTPRVSYGRKMVRERPKILLEDSLSDKYFYDR